MKPLNLLVDWTCHEAYGDPVVVELQVVGEEPRVLCKTISVPRAVDYALRWLAERGLDFLCDVDMHQRLGHRHVTLHATPGPILRAVSSQEDPSSQEE